MRFKEDRPETSSGREFAAQRSSESSKRILRGCQFHFLRLRINGPSLTSWARWMTDRTEPADERDAGGHRAGDLQVMVRRLRSRPRRSRRPRHRLAAATAALFPDQFEDSELGEIPKGWRAGRSVTTLRISIPNGYRSRPRTGKSKGINSIPWSGWNNGLRRRLLV